MKPSIASVTSAATFSFSHLFKVSPPFYVVFGLNWGPRSLTASLAFRQSSSISKLVHVGQSLGILLFLP